MKKLNMRGFVLLETLVVAVFVMAIFTFFFMNVVPLTGEYERRSKYDDIDSKYAAHLLRKLILLDNNRDTILNSVTTSNPYRLITCNDFAAKADCNLLANNLDIVGFNGSSTPSFMISTYNISTLKSRIETLSYPRVTIEYIDYLPSFKPKPDESPTAHDGQWRLLIRRKNETFSNIEVVRWDWIRMVLQPLSYCSVFH